MKKYVCIITFPSDYGTLAPVIPLSNLKKILENLNMNLCLLSGKRLIDILRTRKRNSYIVIRSFSTSSNPFIRVINYLIVQFKICGKILAVLLNLNANPVMFVFGAEILLLPIVIARLLRRKVIFLLGGVSPRAYSARKSPLLKFLIILLTISFSLADRIIVYSPNMVEEGRYARHRHKMLITHEHFVNFTKFAIKRKLDERSNVVGYIGRLSEEKGILNLIKAMPLILKKKADTHFIICGQGGLAQEVEKIIKAKDLEANVKLTGWIPHEDVPRYLNELKLLVFPSFTEGLPNALLEAMACGTPVLATRVGAIPDVIKDGETGFLLKSNDPEHIADRIVELLSKPELLEKVSVNAYNYVRENFSYEKTLEAWRKIFEQLKITN